MSKFTRRNAICTGMALAIPPGIATLITGCNQANNDAAPQAESSDELSTETSDSNPPASGESMKVQYLEIVTPETEALCRQYTAIYGIAFSEPKANFGGARIAELGDGGQIGIRGPLRESETPVVRPYLLVEDIKAAVEAAVESGAEIAMPPMEIPEHGMFAIVINGGIECGFWQN